MLVKRNKTKQNKTKPITISPTLRKLENPHQVSKKHREREKEREKENLKEQTGMSQLKCYSNVLSLSPNPSLFLTSP
jgi:hypothetical protein